MTVDPRAATGFGSRVDAYERGRPEYPAAAVSRLAAEFALTPESTVLDLAAGTGKLTRSLIRLAGRVIAVDPSPAMRSALTHQVPSVEVRDGTAEAIPLSADSVDAVFVGQAFHWFRVREAFQEIARVLRPGGGLGSPTCRTGSGPSCSIRSGRRRARRTPCCRCPTPPRCTGRG